MTEHELERLVVRLIGDSTSYQKMIDEAVATTKTAGKTFENEVMKLNRMGTSLDQVGASTKKSVKEVSKHTEEFGYRVEHLANATGNLVGQMRAMSALESPFGALKEGIALAAEAEKSSVAFGVMLQDRKKGFQLEQDILKFAPETTLKPSGIQQATKMLLQFNAANETTVLPTLKMLGDTAGGDQQRLMSMALAFGQMSGAGRLMGQDLLQMINAGFNPLMEISRTTGKSMNELRDDMENGRITVDMVKNAFKSATSEGGRFKDGMAEGAKTLEGSWGKMEASIEAVKRAIGTAAVEELHLRDAINAVTAAANGTQNWLKEINPVFKTLLAVVGVGVASFGSLIVAWKVVTIAGGMVIGTTRNVWAETKAATIATWEYITALRGQSAAQLQVAAAQASSGGYLGASGTAAAAPSTGVMAAGGAGRGMGKALGAVAVMYGTQWLIDQLPMHQKRLQGYKESINQVAKAQTALGDAFQATILSNQQQITSLGGGSTNEGRAALEEELRQRTQLMGQEGGTSRSQAELEDAKKELENYKGSTMAFLSHLLFTETAAETKIKEAEAAVAGATTRFEAEAKRIQEIKDQLAKPPEQNPEALKALKEYTSRLELQAATLNMTGDQVEVYKLRLMGLKGTQLANASSLQAMNKELEAQKRMEEERIATSIRMEEMVDNLNSKLIEEMDTLGMTSDETELYKLRVAGINEETLLWTKSLMANKKAAEEHNKALEEGKRVTEQFATPIEKFSKQVGDLNKLIAEGAIDRATYDRAMKDASNSLDKAGESAKEARAEIEKLDAVLAGSAEAKHRIGSFTEKISLQHSLAQDSFSLQSKLAAAGQGGLSQLKPGGKDDQATILRDIRDLLKTQKKNQVLVKPSNLQGG